MSYKPNDIFLEQAYETFKEDLENGHYTECLKDIAVVRTFDSPLADSMVEELKNNPLSKFVVESPYHG